MLKGQGGSSSSRPSRGGSNSLRGKGGSSSRLSRGGARSFGGSSTPSGNVAETIPSRDVADVDDMFVESDASDVGGRGDNIEPETPAHPSKRRMIGLLEENPIEYVYFY